MRDKIPGARKLLSTRGLAVSVHEYSYRDRVGAAHWGIRCTTLRSRYGILETQVLDVP